MDTSGKETIAGYIAKAAAKLRADFENIRETNPHAGESGRETEGIVKEFLNRHMPQRFHAASGFVIDIDSEMSQHQDVLVYDAMSSPVYRYHEENQIISADAVAAVVEVKSLLNRKELENAFSKIAEVKRLRKTPLTEMDQKATEGKLTTTESLGIVLGFASDTKLETLARHCAELNELYGTYQRPDLIVVLGVGVINYTAQFVGTTRIGDFATATQEGFPIPPCFVRLVAREDGAYAINRFFAHLLSHLAFFPRRPSIPPLSVMLEGSASATYSAAMYQYNTEARLVSVEPSAPVPSESLRVIKLHAKSVHAATKLEEVGTLMFIPWQDGGVIRMRGGKLPLAVVLKLVSSERAITLPTEGSEFSMVLKVTRPEFEKWPAVIESKSDLKATLEVPPPFEIRQIGNEGTGEPFIARVFLGILEMANSVLSPIDKTAFDAAWGPCLSAALEMRKSLVMIRNLVTNHRNALAKGSIVRKKGRDLVPTERIDGPLRTHVAHFLEMAHGVIDNLPPAVKLLSQDISFYNANETRFLRGCDRYQENRPELVEYLRKWRPMLLEVNEKFKEMRYSGWHLPNVVYIAEDNGLAMKEIKVENLPIVEYLESVFDSLALGIEELVMDGLQKQGKGSLMIDEIPTGSRDPQNAQRFKRNLRGMGIEWQLKWSGKDFYES